MKFHTLILSVFLTINVFGQFNRIESAERDKFYSNRSFSKFTPTDLDLILNYSENHFQLKSFSGYTKYNDTLIFTAYDDSVFNLESYERQYIAGIERQQIMKYDKRKKTIAFLYENSDFDDFDYGLGLWLAISYDEGKSWKHLYTGLTERQPILAKWYSKIKLIKSKNKIQVEAALLQQTEPSIMWEYKLIKDGLILTFKVNELSKDSDCDGLTDIVEKKLYLSPFNNDTDGDGVLDNEDLNPRVSLPRTIKTRIFETVINEEIPFDTTGILIPFDFVPKVNFTSEITKTVLIITNNPDLKSVQPNSTRVIVIPENEYNEQKSKFKSGLSQLWISPFFKVNGEKDTFVFSSSIGMGGGEYLVRKTEKGWLIKQISSWVI